MRSCVLSLVLLAVLLPACGSSEEGDVPVLEQAPAERGAPPETPRPYEEGVDAQAQIDAAVARARAADERVLLMFGANWCVWCRRLDYVLQHDASVGRALAAGYQLVHVDVGARQSDTNRAVAARYGNPMQHGLPCLVVLDAQGEVVHVQETGSLEDGDRHDPARVVAFLNRWRG